MTPSLPARSPLPTRSAQASRRAGSPTRRPPHRRATFRSAMALTVALAVAPAAVVGSAGPGTARPGAPAGAGPARSSSSLSAISVVSALPGLSAASALAWTRTVRIGLVTDRRIREGSGLSRSTYRRNLFFVHNDSGDSARFFAIGNRGSTMATFTLRAPSRDWEDVAAGRYHTLWFGDIGDNGRRRRTIAAIRVAEPRTVRSRALRSTTFRLRYGDGPHDAEGLMVNPTTGRLFVVTKSRSGPGAIYRAPKRLRAGRVNRLRWVARAPERVTGADFGPGGGRFVLRTYGRAYLYHRLGGRPRVVRLPSAGESIGFNRFGIALIVHSEGVREPLWRVRR